MWWDSDSDSESVCDSEPESQSDFESEPEPEPVTQPTPRRCSARLAALAPAAPTGPPLPLDCEDPVMLRQLKEFSTKIGVGMDPGITQAVRAASGIRSQASWYEAEDRALEQFFKQLCEEELDHEQPTRRAGCKPPAGQVDLSLLRPAWSQQRDQPVRGLMWCPVVASRKPPQAPCSSQEDTPTAASEPGPSTPPPAQRSKRTEAEQAAEPTQPTKAE
ncbi:hypothetical protein QJQ45_002600 [Haematococcus lacustris]|nr:hypothetical protein QJQ45_002600 [Haematococcus lacustris]